MADNKFENALMDRLSGCHMDPDRLRLHVRDIVELQKGKIDILDAFPLGKPNPIDVGFLTRAKFDDLPGLLKNLSTNPAIRHIEFFPYGIPFPIWWDVKVKLSDQFQNRF